MLKKMLLAIGFFFGSVQILAVQINRKNIGQYQDQFGSHWEVFKALRSNRTLDNLKRVNDVNAVRIPGVVSKVLNGNLDDLEFSIGGILSLQLTRISLSNVDEYA